MCGRDQPFLDSGHGSAKRQPFAHRLGIGQWRAVRWDRRDHVGTDTGAELKFDAAELTVQAGSEVRVTFENRASVPHNLTFQAPIDVATETVVAPGTSETLEFTAPTSGEYEFVCTLHPGMAGKLIVSAGQP